MLTLWTSTILLSLSNRLGFTPGISRANAKFSPDEPQKSQIELAEFICERFPNPERLTSADLLRGRFDQARETG